MLRMSGRHRERPWSRSCSSAWKAGILSCSTGPIGHGRYRARWPTTSCRFEPVILVPVLGVDLIPWGLLIATVAIYAVAVLALLALGRRTDARALAGFVPDCVRLVRRLLAHPSTTRGQRIALLALIAYLALPIDLIPDFFPVVGVLDDAILVGLALRWLLRTHGEAEIRAAWPGPESSLRIVLVAGA